MKSNCCQRLYMADSQGNIVPNFTINLGEIEVQSTFVNCVLFEVKSNGHFILARHKLHSIYFVTFLGHYQDAGFTDRSISRCSHASCRDAGS